jgi:hypothetical protein
MRWSAGTGGRWRSSSTLGRAARARRPQAAALVAAPADPGRSWDAIVVGEYERAFNGSQYAVMAPLFEHYGIQLWLPETGGRVDYACDHDERAITMLGLSSKREITRTRIRVLTAMAAQTRQGRYLGGRRTGSGSLMPDRTRTRRTPRGAAARLDGVVRQVAGPGGRPYIWFMRWDP